VELRRAFPDDVPAVHALLRELAEVEESQANFTATTDGLHDALFGESPKLDCWVAREDETIIGTALCAPCFVAASCQSVLRLLSLIVHEDRRGTGTGSALLAVVAQHATDDGYSALDFMVREANESAQAFYAQHGAVRRVEWQTWRLPATALCDLAGDTTRRR
jgi:GNAT superfamily N-acetyltransferase